MQLGAHVSTSKGLAAAVDYAISVGADCLQLFAKSPRQWRGPATNPDAAAEFIERRAQTGFGRVFTHTAYLINLATDDPVIREKSIAALADELIRGAVLGVDGVVTHLGNDPAGDPRAAAARVAESILAARDIAGDKAATVRLLLENTAGAGRTFGAAPEELADVIDDAAMPSELLGICFDTCHGFAWGLDVTSVPAWRELATRFDATFGLDRLGLIHANDCLFERGSRKDRHAWIGEGLIREEGFRAMVCEPALSDVAVVTEMPGEAPQKDSINIARLRGLLDSCG